jgi:phosphate transport system substrate-binding protein
VNVLSLDGVQPTLKTLEEGTYPLVKEIRFATTARSVAGTGRLLAWILSAKGRAIAKKAGVLVVAPASRP